MFNVEGRRGRRVREGGLVVWGLVVFFVGFLVLGVPNVVWAGGSDGGTTRVVSLVPNLTELLFAMGAGDQVVGVSDFCRFPVEARGLPSVGGLVNPGLEATLALGPDVVLLYRSQLVFAGKLERLGVRVELFDVDRLADLYGAIERLGVLTGTGLRSAGRDGLSAVADRLSAGSHPRSAAGLSAEIRSGLAAVRRRAADDGRTSGARAGDGGGGVRGIVIVSRDPAGLGSMYQAAGGNFLGELFEIAGGRLAIREGAAVSREDIIRADPDVIIDLSGTEGGDGDNDDGGSRRAVGPWAALTTVDAVRNGRVYMWADPHVMLLGPSVVRTAQEMRRIVEAVRGD